MDKNQKITTRRFIVTGKVQGVFFRAATREQAVKLGLAGYAKNLESGQVEVLAQGDAEIIEELRVWLNKGSRYSKVESIVEVHGETTELQKEFITI